MVRKVIKKPKPTTSWGAGGHSSILGQKPPSKASVLKYLRAIEKRDGVKKDRI